MAQNSELYNEVGLDVITEEEHELLTSVLSAVADADAADPTGTMTDEAQTPDPNMVDNVYYINFNPKTETQSTEMLARLTEVTKNVNLSSSFMSTKASQAMNAKLESKQLLHSEETKKANYRAKVINHLVTQSPWITTVGIQTQKKTFEAKEETFHGELVKHFTEGLDMPKNILDKLEGFLNNVKRVVNSTINSTDSIQFYIFISIYKKDDVLQTWRPYIRTIYFKPSQSLGTYTKKKGDDSSGRTVKVEFEYVQSDGSFNDDLFVSSAKPALEQSQSKAAKDFATSKEVIDIDV